MSKLRLGVNIDHVATVRNARGEGYPDPVRAAEMALAAGADGITAHLREDRRHISDADIDALAAICRRRGRPLALHQRRFGREHQTHDAVAFGEHESAPPQ